jgi:hypothetical protein
MASFMSTYTLCRILSLRCYGTTSTRRPICRKKVLPFLTALLPHFESHRIFFGGSEPRERVWEAVGAYIFDVDKCDRILVLLVPIGRKKSCICAWVYISFTSDFQGRDGHSSSLVIPGRALARFLYRMSHGVQAIKGGFRCFGVGFALVQAALPCQLIVLAQLVTGCLSVDNYS